MKVAVAVIFDKNSRVLITQRPLNVSHGGLWEFPGGKLENGETPLAALQRELAEEIGIHIDNAEFLTEIKHVYSSKEVILLVFYIYQFQGIPTCRESQLDMQWVEISDLKNYSFPVANKQIIDLIYITQFHSQNIVGRAASIRGS